MYRFFRSCKILKSSFVCEINTICAFSSSSYKASLNAMDIAYKRPHRLIDTNCNPVMHGVIPSVPSSSGNFTLTFNNNQINNQINALHSQVFNKRVLFLNLIKFDQVFSNFSTFFFSLFSKLQNTSMG